jgi:cytochrome c peroxidase
LCLVLLSIFLATLLRITMAAAARSASRAFLRSTPATSSFRPAARSARFNLPSQAFRASSRRGYASEAGPPKSSKTPIFLGLAAGAGAGVYFYLNGNDITAKGPFTPTQKDYQNVYNEIASRMDDEKYDDGSYGPVSGHFPTCTAADQLTD